MAKGKVLELLRPDDNGKVQTISSTEVFGVIRAIQQFRLTGQTKVRALIGTQRSFRRK